MKSYISIIGYLPALLMDLGVSAVHTGAAFYASRLGASSTAWGTVIFIKGIIYVLFSIPFGRASDKFGRNRLLVAACGLTALIYVLVPQCKTFAQMAVLFPIAGIPQAMFWPVFEAWLTEKHDKGGLIRRLMMFNIFWSLGTTFGSFVAGHIAEISFFTPFYLAAIVGLINILIILIQPKKSDKIPFDQIDQFDQSVVHKRLGSPDPAPERPKVSIHPAQRRKYLHIAWIANFGSWFTLGVLRFLTPKLMMDAGSSTGYFGNLMFILGGIQTLMFLILGSKLTKSWHYKISPLLSFQLLGCGAFIALWSTLNPLVWSIGFALVGSVVAMTYFSSMYYGLHGHVDVGNKSGIHEAILGSGILLGPFLGGAMADLFGTKAPYLFCVFLIAACIIAEMWLANHINGVHKGGYVN